MKLNLKATKTGIQTQTFSSLTMNCSGKDYATKRQRLCHEKAKIMPRKGENYATKRRRLCNEKAKIMPRNHAKIFLYRITVVKGIDIFDA